MSESSYKIITLSTDSKAFDQYKGAVLTSWLHGLKWGSKFFSLVDNHSYYTIYSKILNNLLTRPGTTARIAVLTDDTDVLLGWSVFEGSVLHFVFVKREVRKQGIGTELLPANAEVITHLTERGKVIWKKKFQYLKFNPF